ncbi:unnamed protein product [Durusdinium trenchii]|uniref:Uncharacterized protein n=2 Tax=Durusdinium trenchii TaxID=1381693 RepID=A0ABP0N340_9DINO
MSEAAASSNAPFVSSSQSHPSKKEGWPEVPAFSATSPCFRSAALAVDAVGGEKWRLREGYASEGPSESSVNVEDTEDESLQQALPGLERFYETMAAKAQIKPGAGSSSSWVLSMARSYRRLSKEKRRRGRLKELLQPAGQGVLRSASGGNLACPEHLCWSSTDDSGYEAGYETDADESELSEWESGNVRQGHKRKLEALVNLTMQMSFSAEIPSGQKNEETLGLAESARQPPPKTLRALGTRPVGLRLSLPNGSDSVAQESKTTPEGQAAPMPVLAPPDSQNYASLASTQLLPRPSQEHPWTEKLQPSVYYDATNAALDSHVNVQSWMATPEARDAAMEVE